MRSGSVFRLVAGLGGATALMIACGGGTSSVPDAPTSSTSGMGTSGTSTSGATSGSSGGTALRCPEGVPSGACPREGFACEYGEDPRPTCRTRAECTSGSWVVVSPSCTALPQATCPGTQAAASGKECAPKDALCEYGGSLCECTNCTKYPVEQCDGPATWRCEAPADGAGCPAGRPRLGTACASEGAMCVYGCESGVSRTCSGGNWASASAPGGCPRSTRKVKTDIHYLTDDERRLLSDEARALRLTTWRYVGKLDDGRTHVGYILEDSPTSAASNMKREEVDLYAYTSMTLALAQQQQREIDELRRELGELKKTTTRR